MKRIAKFLVVLGISLLILSPVYISARDLSLVIEDIATEIVSKKAETNFKLDEDSYELITYNEIMRKRDGLNDVKHTFYAEVSQYEEVADMDMAFSHVVRDGDYNERYLLIFATLPDSRLIEDDVIDVYGTLYGLTTYETVMGASKTIPVILVDEVLVKGIDY